MEDANVFKLYGSIGIATMKVGMSQAIEKLADDWYETACGLLESLRREAEQIADDDDVVPEKQLFDSVLQFFNLLRDSKIGYIDAPDVWVSADGELGLSWSNEKKRPAKRVDVLFESPDTVSAVLCMGKAKTKSKKQIEIVDMIRSFAA